ncbi:MAG: HD domain-containing protein [Proteobacteria bacterium]|nr:HD domain-containing protein [Pseudomonadota bacterium]
MKDIFVSNGLLDGLYDAVSFEEKIKIIHRALKQHLDVIDRISVILYDARMESLTTFIHSGRDNPLSFYGCEIEKAPSLLQLKKLKKPRLVNDLDLFSHGENEHTRKIADQGYHSSYSVPMFDGDDFLGVVFFNSYQPHGFDNKILLELNLYAQLINSLILNKLQSTRMMVGAFKSALNLVSYKDPETGNHLERMARYSRLIAQELARSGEPGLTDEIIEHLFLFAPLHDIGKIGIPDNILLKPAKLDDAEWKVMKTHSSIGRDIIDTIADQIGLEAFEHIHLLRNISESHHETIDGLGYPNQLKNNEIAIETQIVAVADIFDALTSKRPYKDAWTNAQALDELQKLSGTKLNVDCVKVLRQKKQAVEEIQRRFQDESHSGPHRPPHTGAV